MLSGGQGDPRAGQEAERRGRGSRAVPVCEGGAACHATPWGGEVVDGMEATAAPEKLKELMILLKDAFEGLRCRACLGPAV